MYLRFCIFWAYKLVLSEEEMQSNLSFYTIFQNFLLQSHGISIPIGSCNKFTKKWCVKIVRFRIVSSGATAPKFSDTLNLFQPGNCRPTDESLVKGYPLCACSNLIFPSTLIWFRNVYCQAIVWLGQYTFLNEMRVLTWKNIQRTEAT